jgi:hypothetical protein
MISASRSPYCRLTIFTPGVRNSGAQSAKAVYAGALSEVTKPDVHAKPTFSPGGSSLSFARSRATSVGSGRSRPPSSPGKSLNRRR